MKSKFLPIIIPFRTAYDGRAREVSEITSIEFTQPSMTRQSEADACDINKIMAQYRRSGLLSHVNKYQGRYEDITALAETDFQSALNMVIEAEEMFETVPADIREKFMNDPGKFLEFATNPENVEEMRELGLATPAEEPLRAPPGERSEPVSPDPT